MRTVNDILRSTKDHLSLVLGDSWEVRIPGNVEVAFDRPYAEVARVGAHAVLRQGYRFTENTQPLVISCYPVTNLDPELALLAAGDVEDRLYRGFWQGVDVGWPCRIPLYDYDGIPLGRMSRRRDPRDYMRVLDFSTQTTADPTDPRYLTVAVDLRVAWIAQAALPSVTRTVERVMVEENLG